MPPDLAKFLAWLEDHADAAEYLDVHALVHEYLGQPAPPVLFDPNDRVH